MKKGSWGWEYGVPRNAINGNETEIKETEILYVDS